MSGDAKAVTMTKGSMTIVFDTIIPTKNGALYYTCFKRTGGVSNDEIASGVIGKGTQISIEKAHQLLGHCNENATRQTAKQLEC